MRQERRDPSDSLGRSITSVPARAGRPSQGSATVRAAATAVGASNSCGSRAGILSRPVAAMASSISSAEEKRLAGSFSSARMITASKSGDTSGRRSRSGGTGSRTCAMATATGAPPPNGGSPTRHA